MDTIAISDGKNHVQLPYDGPKIRFWNNNQTFNGASTCPWAHRSQIVLVEKQIPFELKIVDLGNKSNEFMQTYHTVSPDPNARAKVPILEVLDDKGNVTTRLIESRVVSTFLEENWNRGTELLPKDPLLVASIDMFVDTFMDKVVPFSFSLMISQNQNDCLTKLQKLGDGLCCVGRCFDLYGGNSEVGPYFLGASYTLAECLTTSFVVRMLAQLKHQRGLCLLNLCNTLGLPRVRRWMEAVRNRESTQRTTPAIPSLIQLQPYLRKVFKPFKLDQTSQDECMAKARSSFGSKQVGNEASFNALVAEGASLNAKDKKLRQKKIVTTSSAKL